MLRDPLGEDGGINLYELVGNDSINFWDYLGKSWSTAKGLEALEFAKEIKWGSGNVKLPQKYLSKCCLEKGEFAELNMNRIKGAHCIQFAVSVLTCGYSLNDDKESAKLIRERYKSSKFTGSSIAKMMVSELGWKPIFFDRDFTTHKHSLAKWGDSITDAARQISSGENPFGFSPDGAVTDFAPWNESNPFVAPESYSELIKLKFAFGMYNDGYHNFILSNNEFYENRDPQNKDFRNRVKEAAEYARTYPNFNPRNWAHAQRLYDFAQGFLFLPPDQNVPKAMIDNLESLRGLNVPDLLKP